MAVATGSQIRPELSAVDYTPFLQAAGQSAQMQAQGIAAGVGGALRGFESYVQQQKENKQLEAEVKSAEKLGQALQPFLAQVNPEAGAQVNTLLASVADPNVSLRERSAVAKNIGSALNNILNLAQLGKQTQDQKAAAEYAGLLRSGGGSIPTPISNAALSRFTPEQRLAGEEMFLRGEQVRTGIEKSRAETKKLMAPAAADLTAAQKDTEAIIASEIATGVLNPDDRAAISRRRAQLLSRGGRADRETERFQSVSSIVDESGNYLGQGVFDQKSGKFGLVNEKTGEIEPLPKGAKPSTVSGMSRGMLSAPQFLQLRTKLGQDEIALGRLSEYFDSVEDSRQGIDLLADKITTAVKTLVTTQKLSPTELAQAKSAGELQALLGSTRLEVLGGGVLTENDAVRLILNLGGDINALRNKEVVRTQLARIYEDKYKTYKRDLEDYNVQVAGGYGAQGYKPAVSIEFDQKLLKTYKSPQAQKRDESMINSISKRIAELEAKMKSSGSSK